MSDTLPRAEHARPPGWTPPVHPPPAPVAGPAVFRPTPPPPARSRPAHPAAKPGTPAAAAPPTAPGRPEGFALLAWFLGFRLIGRITDLLFSTGTPTGFVEGVARMVEVGSVACAAALVVGLWRCERWVGRAAIFWAASLALLRITGEMDSSSFPTVSDFIWSSLIVAMVLPVATAAYVWEKAGQLPASPSPSPSP
jgi:hypothetical protein